MSAVVFRSIPDPTHALKAQLARELVARVEGWRADYAGHWLRSDYSAMSKLRNGDLRRFSLQRLVRMASAVGIEVSLITRTVSIPPPVRGVGHPVS